MTRIAVTTAAGRARLTLTGGPITPRLLRAEENGARVGLVATSALLLGGDHIEIDIEVGPGAWLEVVETAGTVAYDAGGTPSSWQVRIRIADGGLLIWHAEPFVVSSGANVRRSTEIRLGEHAVACLRESLVLGRTGESAGAVRSTLSARHGQRQLLVEDLDLTDPAVRALPGIIGTARVLDTVSLLGMRAPDAPELRTGLRFELDGPGTLARCLTSGLALSPLAAFATAWSAAAAEAQIASARSAAAAEAQIASTRSAAAAEAQIANTRSAAAVEAHIASDPSTAAAEAHIASDASTAAAYATTATTRSTTPVDATNAAATIL